jgi:MATE family multidrug resistance protein
VDHVVLVMVSLITASLVNWAGDWAFLYGHLGFHAMGIAGSGWSTVIVRLYMAALLVIAMLFSMRAHGEWPSFDLLHPDWRRLRLLFRIGWAPSVGSITDYGVSTCMSILCARLGTTLLAAHQVVLDLDAFVYMVPMGLSYATAVRVGQSAGRNSLPQIRRSAKASIILSAAYISIAASLFAGFPRFWGNLYTNDSTVVTAAVPIFLICGFLQLADAIGIIFLAAFTGIGDTRTPFFVNLFWYWAVGMPAGYWLTFGQGLSLRGLWAGRAIASFGSTITIALLWRSRLRRLEQPTLRHAISLFAPAHAK